MIFNRHSNLAGAHAFLSASNYHWIRYDADKLERIFMAWKAAQRGTALHDLAKDMIRLGVKPERTGTTFSEYVNDCVGFKMKTEQVLYYSPNCYGTADAIDFKESTRKLRIFDLKTGKHTSSMDQLKVYAALFCLEYKWEPFEIEIELRIYQNDAIDILEPEPTEIKQVVEQIKFLDKRLIELIKEVEL
jgi:hypothetical protein